MRTADSQFTGPGPASSAPSKHARGNLCASWTRSAVIDPRGCVREILQARPGVIRVLPEDGSGGDDPTHTLCRGESTTSTDRAAES